MKLLFICDATLDGNELRCASWIKSILAYADSGAGIVLASTALDPSKKRISALSDGRPVDMIPLPISASDDETDRILRQENADVIVIFGTEKPYTLKELKACERIGALDHTALFAQGMARACALHYAEGVPCRVVRRWTVRDILRRQNIRTEQKAMESAAERERQALRLTRHFIGRTTMDRAILRTENPAAAYYPCNDVLRPCFYEGRWQYQTCEKHRIFISQYYYPLKGFHYLLAAAAQLRERYPDLKIAAAGYNPIQSSVTQNELKDSSYIRYVKSLIRRYDLQDHIELLGVLDAQAMKAEYLRSNVFVMPSAIENSPNSLAEAMMLGVPCVASDVGGVSDFALHRQEAYLYPSSAIYLLAYYIDRVFGDEAAAQTLSENGRQRALKEYDKQKNITEFENIMQQIARPR